MIFASQRDVVLSNVPLGESLLQVMRPEDMPPQFGKDSVSALLSNKALKRNDLHIY